MKGIIQETLNVAVFQFDQVWEDTGANLAIVDHLLQEIGENTDVVFLPEMFTTGFSMNVADLAQPMNGRTIRWMKDRAAKHQLALCGSLIIRENDECFNRLVFVEPSGILYFYNKRHLFSMGFEDSSFRKGTERLIVDYKGWRICPLICYDLRFPVWARNRNEYDLLVYSANWPQSRDEVWNTLLKARAIENQCYVVGANRNGTDGNTISYSGNSQVIGPKGTVLSSVDGPKSGIIVAALSYSELLGFRASFPVLNDADDFYITEN